MQSLPPEQGLTSPISEVDLLPIYNYTRPVPHLGLDISSAPGTLDIMPHAPQRPCRHLGCPTLTDGGWCDQHNPERFNDDRESACKRGYDRRWRKWRRWYLTRHPLCVDCQAQGRITAAEQVHHIMKVAEHPTMQYVEDNCMSLCAPCHAIRSGRGE